MVLATSDTLDAQLIALGKTLCQYGTPLVRRVRAARWNAMPEWEWQHHGRAAAYLAFIDLGGDPDQPDAFGWNNPQLLKRGLSYLQDATLGGESEFYDERVRGRNRKSGSLNAELCWDAWLSATPDDTGAAVDAPAARSAWSQWTPSVEAEVSFEDAMDRAVVEEQFEWAILRVLPPQEAVWLIRRFRDGVATKTLAEELVAKEPRYAGPNGLARATNYIDVTVHRAKAKAKKLLGADWSAFVEGALG
jgi:hypothetical protein